MVIHPCFGTSDFVQGTPQVPVEFDGIEAEIQMSVKDEHEVSLLSTELCRSGHSPQQYLVDAACVVRSMNRIDGNDDSFGFRE